MIYRVTYEMPPPVGGRWGQPASWTTVRRDVVADQVMFVDGFVVFYLRGDLVEAFGFCAHVGEAADG